MLVGNFEQNPTATKPLFCERSLKFFPPLKGTNSKTTHFHNFIVIDNCFSFHSFHAFPCLSLGITTVKRVIFSPIGSGD